MQLRKRLGFDIVNFTDDPGYLGIYIGGKNPLRVRVVNRRWGVGIMPCRCRGSIEPSGDQQGDRDPNAEYYQCYESPLFHDVNSFP